MKQFVTVLLRFYQLIEVSYSKASHFIYKSYYLLKYTINYTFLLYTQDYKVLSKFLLTRVRTSSNKLIKL